MTRHYFEYPGISLHYYKYGCGKQAMLCFHGYGMHGKQFRILESDLGTKYTFYGFDLFFHKETKLLDQSLSTVRKGITKKELADIIKAFCEHEQIERFSVIGYSMGTHYATSIVEEMPDRIEEYIVAAPSCLNPGKVVRYFAKNWLGNRILSNFIRSEKKLFRLLRLIRIMGFIDSTGHNILHKEIATKTLRFNFYASLTYLRKLETDKSRLEEVLKNWKIKSIFIYGKGDKMYSTGTDRKFISRLRNPKIVVLDETHEMINQNFSNTLSELLS
jgi:pimeloyl-ACP methyl ester carboxylesterase